MKGSRSTEQLSSALSLLQRSPKDPPKCNPQCLQFYKIPTALQLPSLACQDSSISNSVSWCLDLCQRPAFAPNDSQLRGHWEGLNSICRPCNLIRGAGFLFSPKFAVARMNDGQRMSCQHQQRLGDKRKKIRGYKKFFFYRRNESILIDSTVSCWVNCSGDNVVFAECHSVWAARGGMDPATRADVKQTPMRAFSFFLSRLSVQPF